MTDTLTMAQTAEAIGLSYEHFRKVWPDMNVSEGLPAPLHTHVWSAKAIEAWKIERSNRVVVLGPRRRKPREPDPAAPPAIDAGQMRRARRSLDAARAG